MIGLMREPRFSKQALVPIQDTERPQRVPTAGLAVTILQRKVDLAGMRVLQQPCSVGLLSRSEQCNGFADTCVRLTPNRPEVVEGAQYVVVPVGRK